MAKKSKADIIKIYSWNVNGIRAIQKKGFMEWVAKCKGDIICLQETKAQPEQLDDSIKEINDFKSYWFSAEKKGYSSVAIYTKPDPKKTINGFNNKKFDSEGRVIFAEYDKFVLANVYFPNGGRGPERVRYKLDFYNELFFNLEKNYRDRKGIIVVGDYNTAHKEIDLARPKENVNTSGFMPEEREWIDKIINLGYTDIFRKFNKEPNQYSYWDQISRARDRNIGWRIDYFMVSNDIAGKVKKAEIHQDVFGSDHCPISIDLEL
ncbi:MAG: exodeoxyribonuclease III [Ignavibacteriae bacterium]|nr:exodeoxyribonuclease III [Ignavibacteriota bacterium]